MRNEKFHAYNRFYLLAILFMSILLPLLELPALLDMHQAPAIGQLQAVYGSIGENVTVTNVQKWHPVNIGLSVLAAIALLLLLKFAMAIRQVILIRKRSSIIQSTKDFVWLSTEHADAPFSFFKWLFWNTVTDAYSAKGRQMLRHEYYHISRKHSWDIIFVELMTAIFWFNPFFHVAKKEIKTIQEFLADDYAVKDADVIAYAELLVMQNFHTPNVAIVNPFFHNQLKRRIAMLTNSRTPVHQYLRKIMVLPLVAIAILIFSCKQDTQQNDAYHKKPVEADQSSIAEKPKENPGTISYTYNGEPMEQSKAARINGEDISKIETIETGSKKVIKIEGKQHPRFNETPTTVSTPAPSTEANEPELFTEVEQDAAFPGGNIAWRKFLEQTLNSQVPVDNGANSGTYTVKVKFIVSKDGSTSDVKALTNHGYGMEAEAIKGIKASGKWIPARQNGKIVKAYRIQPITFQITEE